MIEQATYAVPRADLGAAVHEFDYSGMGFIAESCLPTLNVLKKAATMSVIVRENLKRANDNHANGADFNRIGLNAEDLAYACIDHALEGLLTDEDRNNYVSDFDGEVETVQSILVKLLNEQEIRVKTALFNTSTFSGGDLYLDVSSAPWDAAASDAIGHIFAAKEKVRKNTGIDPDSMTIGAVTLINLLANTAIKARFPGVAVLSLEIFMANLSAIFGLRNLFVGRAVYDSAKEGKSFTSADIWPDDYALIFKQQTGGTRINPGLGRIILWESMNNEMVPVQYREENKEADIFRLRRFGVEKVFDPYFGFLLKVDA